MGTRTAHGHGLSTIAGDAVLDTWYPAPRLGPADGPLPADLAAEAGTDAHRGVRLEAVTVEIDLDSPPASVSDAYLRLHLLSHCLVAPNTIDLSGLFGVLPTVVWTTAGAMTPDSFARRRPQLARAGIVALGIDKFPRLVDFVVPDRVRIADASRVRLGAHLAPGTVVMHEGFVNFNAGTLGTSMVEGRVSQGVVVGDGSDIGGGASIMGTLSGGGTQRVAIGARTLLGANAGLGIPLGDDCVVEAGLYLTAGTKLTLLTEQPRVVKAAELAGASGLLFRRNSLSGGVEAVPRRGVGVTLNAALHS